MVGPASNLSTGEVKEADPWGSLDIQRGSLVSFWSVEDSASEKQGGQHFVKNDTWGCPRAFTYMITIMHAHPAHMNMQNVHTHEQTKQKRKICRWLPSFENKIEAPHQELLDAVKGLVLSFGVRPQCSPHPPHFTHFKAFWNIPHCFTWDLASCESQLWWRFLPHLPGLTLWCSVEIYSNVPSLETQPPSPCHLLSPQPALLSSSHPSAVCNIFSITIGREPGHVRPQLRFFFFCLKSVVSLHATEPGMLAFLI